MTGGTLPLKIRCIIIAVISLYLSYYVNLVITAEKSYSTCYISGMSMGRAKPRGSGRKTPLHEVRRLHQHVLDRQNHTITGDHS